MNLRNKYILFSCIVLTLTPIIYSTLTTTEITATDWVYRHSVWIDRYINGDFSSIFQYPPLFHFLMLPFVYFHFPVVYLQIVFAVLSLFGILYTAYKLENETTLVLMAMFLASSLAFMMFSSALMPQSLDYFLFPLTCIFYFKKKYAPTILILIIMFLMHILGIVFIFILFLHSLLTRKYKFTKILFIILIILVSIFYYYYFIASYEVDVKWDVKAQEKWESDYIFPIYKFFIFSGSMTWLSLVFSIYFVTMKKVKLNEKHLLYLIWALSFIPLSFFGFGIWRATSYSIIPLSYLVASIYSNRKL